MGPLELMYSWPALLCAAACVGLVQLVKAMIDTIMGKEARKANRWLSTVILPALPVVMGFLYAITIPLRPEPLLDFVDARVEGTWMQLLAFGGWGAACGQFATTLHDKLKDFLKHGN